MEVYMTQFEEKSCKVLGVIIFLLVVMTWLQISGCYSSPQPEMEDEPIPDYIDEVEISNLA